MEKGPVVSAFKVPNNFRKWWDNRKSDKEIYVLPSNYNNKHNPTSNGHAIVLTGWGKNKKGVAFWELRNTWGVNNKSKSAFCYFPMTTTKVPSSKHTGIDIPIRTDNDDVFIHGAVSFEADKIKPKKEKYIPSSYDLFVESEEEGAKEEEDDDDDDDSKELKKNNILLFFFICIIVLLIIITTKNI